MYSCEIWIGSNKIESTIMSCVFIIYCLSVLESVVISIMKMYSECNVWYMFENNSTWLAILWYQQQSILQDIFPMYTEMSCKATNRHYMCVHFCDKVSIRICMWSVALWTDQRTIWHTGTPPQTSTQDSLPRIQLPGGLGCCRCTDSIPKERTQMSWIICCHGKTNTWTAPPLTQRTK